MRDWFALQFIRAARRLTHWALLMTTWPKPSEF